MYLHHRLLQQVNDDKYHNYNPLRRNNCQNSQLKSDKHKKEQEGFPSSNTQGEHE